ncbi:Molybdenum cofactor guanylyltransferase [Candidatus Calditenuaceae archaeon HR02]|nr:Molybdenum cofactor guanylyltransferase [Candidatus Calditenuaceae archaeon HR02]
MTATAIVLTDFSGIGGVQRGLYKILDKPMIEYVLDALPDEVDELVISVRDEAEKEAYSETAEKYMARIHVSGAGLGGALKSYMPLSESDRFLILPCDAPLISQEFATFILESCRKFSATILRDAAGRADYLFSAYRKTPFLEACGATGSEEIDEITRHMKNVLYIYIGALKIFDQKMNILFRVANSSDAKRAERIIRGKMKRL